MVLAGTAFSCERKAKLQASQCGVCLRLAIELQEDCNALQVICTLQGRGLLSKNKILLLAT